MAAGRQKKLFGKVRKVMSYLILIFAKENWKPMSRLFMLCGSKPEKNHFFVFYIIQSNVRSSTQDMGEGSITNLKKM